MPVKQTIQEAEQAINNVLMIKQFLESVPGVFEALAPAQGPLLRKVRELCRPDVTKHALERILKTIRPEATHVKTALDLRNQRTFAVQVGNPSALITSRLTATVWRKRFSRRCSANLSRGHRRRSQPRRPVEGCVSRPLLSLELELRRTDELNLNITVKYEAPRMYYLRFKSLELGGRPVPDVLINQVRKKGGNIECQTLTLRKLNQRIADSAIEAVAQTQRVIDELLDAIRLQVPQFFRVCESIALLDMMLAFADLATLRDYVRPIITDTLALKTARHPLLDKVSCWLIARNAH
jgi:DNA mismatch repair protein MSH4